MKDWLNIFKVSLGLFLFSLFFAFIMNNFTLPSKSNIWDSIMYMLWTIPLIACWYFYYKVNKK